MSEAPKITYQVPGCGVFCNVVRMDACGECGGWVSYCVTHQRPTKANRCTCTDPRLTPMDTHRRRE